MKMFLKNVGVLLVAVFLSFLPMSVEAEENATDEVIPEVTGNIPEVPQSSEESVSSPGTGGTPGETAKAKRDQILGLSASKASTLNKVAAIGGAATGVTSTITSGVGAFATDFSSMKSRIDACLNSLNISQN